VPVARSGILWRRIFVLLVIATTASYLYYSRREFPHGGSRWGLGYGIAASALILLLAFFGIRKRWYRTRFGTLEQWLQSHIYLGVLVLLILVFHTGGRFNDKIAVTTFILAAIVIVSGIVGAIFYVTIPRLLTEVESNLTVEEISNQLNQLGKQMARIASDQSAPFQRIYLELMRESAPGWLAGWRLLFTRMRRRESQLPGDWTTLLSLVVQSANVVVLWLAGLSLGVGVPASYYWILVPVVTLLTLFPVSLNGMGVREWGTVLLLAPLGVGAEAATALAFLWFLTFGAVSAAGAGFYLFGRFPRFEVRSDDKPVRRDPDQGREGQHKDAA